MYHHPDHEQGTDGGDGLIVPYGLRVRPPEALKTKRWRQLATLIGPFLALGVMVAAVWVLMRILRDVKLADVYAAASAMSITQVAASIGLVALSYCFLILYDLLALNHIGKRVTLAAVSVGGFVSFALANTIGFVLLVAGGVRYRIYGPSGITAPDVGVITVMSGLTFALSAMVVLGVSLLLAPGFATVVNGLPGWVNFTIGLSIVIALGGYLGWVASGRKSLTMSGYEISLPGPLSTAGLIATGVGDMVCAAGALYMLVPGDPGTGFPIFVGLFAAAITLGLLSHVPGGVGVFESIMLLAVPNIPLEKMLASLLVFRVIYYLLPMLVAMVTFGWYEARRAPVIERMRSTGRLIRLLGHTISRSARELFQKIESEFRKRPGSY